MPLKLPAPDLGTDAQPVPKSVVVAPELDGMAEAIEEELEGIADDEALAADDDDAEVPELPELHAAAPSARPAVTTETATRRVFTISLLHMKAGWFTFTDGICG
jgi:hypothetical protein